MSAPEAADVAGITYRQLDYWGRKGWVVPAHVQHVSAGRRVRRYDLEDVLRLAALAHLGRSGLDVATYGPTVGSLELATGDSLVVVGPDDELEVVAAADLRTHLSRPGRYVVFDPRPLRQSLTRGHAVSAPATMTERRSA